MLKRTAVTEPDRAKGCNSPFLEDCNHIANNWPGCLYTVLLKPIAHYAVANRVRFGHNIICNGVPLKVIWHEDLSQTAVRGVGNVDKSQGLSNSLPVSLFSRSHQP